MARLLLSILVIVALSLTACTPTPERSAETQSPPPTEQPPQAVRQPPPEFIKGIWMPVPFNAFSFGFDAMKEDGMNTFGTQMIYQYQEDGTFIENPAFSHMNEMSISAFESAKAIGLRTWLVLAAAKELGEPQPISAEVLKSTNFLKDYSEKVLEVAKLAEDYQIDFFSPYDEPDYRLCQSYFSSNDEEVKNICVAWIHDIIPEIRKVYNGKIIFKAALNQDCDYSLLDISGYDYFGVTIPLMRDKQSQIERTRTILDRAFNLAKETNATVLVTEFGAWGEAINMPEKDKVERETIILEEVKDRVGGICIGDYPKPGGSIKNTAQEELIKEYFTQIIIE